MMAEPVKYDNCPICGSKLKKRKDGKRECEAPEGCGCLYP